MSVNFGGFGLVPITISFLLDLIGCSVDLFFGGLLPKSRMSVHFTETQNYSVETICPVISDPAISFVPELIYTVMGPLEFQNRSR